MPSVAGWRPLLPSALMTARSVTASRPRISAFALLPSLNATVIDPPSSAADSTTWLLVRIWPSLLMMMPVPDPAWPPPATLTWVDGRQQLLGDLLDLTGRCGAGVGAGVERADDTGRRRPGSRRRRPRRRRPRPRRARRERGCRRGVGDRAGEVSCRRRPARRPAARRWARGRRRGRRLAGRRRIAVHLLACELSPRRRRLGSGDRCWSAPVRCSSVRIRRRRAARPAVAVSVPRSDGGMYGCAAKGSFGSLMSTDSPSWLKTC